MPGHTARYCRALADWYAITGEEDLKRRALSGFNAVTYMQSPAGLFRTYFASVNPKADTSKRPDWYSQHLYTVCHILEAMSVLPELAPVGQDHLLVGDVFVREVRYAPGAVSFQTLAPSKSVLRLSFTPQTVRFDQRELPLLDSLPSDGKFGWHFDAAARLLTIRHAAGAISVRGAAAK